MSIMKSKLVALLCLCVVILLVLFARTCSVHANPDAADEAMNTIRPEAIRADMRFLSDDALEGRGTGSRVRDRGEVHGQSIRIVGASTCRRQRLVLSKRAVAFREA